MPRIEAAILLLSTCHYADFLNDEMLDMINKGYWVVLPYHSLWHYPHLKLSPAGVIPQCNRRPRTIVDYSYSGVNQAMTKIVPSYFMQFGRALQRLLQHLVYANPRFGPIYMCKVD